jgi:hypothetical protein
MRSNGRERALLAALLALGLAVFWPSLRARFYFDDHFHVAMLAGRWPTPRNALDLYHFVGEGDRAGLLERGVLPWWSSPELRVRFLRPLSSLLLAADHRLAHGRVFLMHVHSFVWWCACVLAVHGLFRRLLAARTAFLATAIFALAPCHVVPLAWLANREALVSLALGALALQALVAHLESGRLRHLASLTLMASLALLGGEYALSLLGYVLALVVLRVEVPRARRVAAFAAFAGPTLVYLLLRRALGCGARGAGFYLDPLAAPFAFLREAPRRFATLALDAWLGLDPRTLEDWPTLARVVGLVAVAALLAVPAKRAIESLEGAARASALALFVGSLLALVPVLAVAPHPRVLGAAMVGASASLAVLMARAFWPPAPEPRAGEAEYALLAATLLGFAHFVHAPVTAWLGARNFRDVTAFFEASAARVAEEVPDGERSRVVVLRGLGAAFYLPFAIDEQFGRRAAWSILAQGDHVLVLHPSARELEVVAPAGKSLYPSGQDQLFRSDDERFRVGDRVEVPGLRARIVEVGASGPRRVRFTFDRELDDASVAWLSESSVGVAPVAVPNIGFGLPLPR